MYVCICHAVTDLQVDAAILAGADTPEAVGESTGAGTSCGGCEMRICARIDGAARPALASYAVAWSA